MSDERMALAEALVKVEAVAELLASACERIEIAGSIRRGKETVKDAELVAISLPGDKLLALLDALVERGTIAKAIYPDGKTRWGQKYRGFMYDGLRVEVFIADAENWGYQYWLRTGPAEANVYVMQWLAWKLSPIRAKDGYWWWGEHQLKVESEEAMFTLLGLPFIRPAFRTEQVYRNHFQQLKALKLPDMKSYLIQAPKQMVLWNFERMQDLEAKATKNEPTTAVGWPCLDNRKARQVTTLRNPSAPLYFRARWWGSSDYDLMAGAVNGNVLLCGAWGGKVLIHWMDARRRHERRAAA